MDEVEEAHQKSQKVIVKYNNDGDLSSNPYSLSIDSLENLSSLYHKNSNMKTRHSSTSSRSQLFPLLDDSIMKRIVNSEKEGHQSQGIHKIVFLSQMI